MECGEAMAQKVKVLVPKPDSQSSIIETHVVEKESIPKSCPLTYTCIHTLKQKTLNI